MTSGLVRQLAEVTFALQPFSAVTDAMRSESLHSFLSDAGDLVRVVNHQAASGVAGCALAGAAHDVFFSFRREVDFIVRDHRFRWPIADLHHGFDWFDFDAGDFAERLETFAYDLLVVYGSVRLRISAAYRSYRVRCGVINCVSAVV